MASGSDGIDWAPYHNRGEAEVMLGRLVNRMLSSDLGIVWYFYGAAIVLRKPRRDTFGFGHSVIFQWHPIHHGPPPDPAPPAAPVPAKNFFTKFLTDKDNEHGISFGFDIIAIVATTAIAIPAAAAGGTAVAGVTLVALAGAALCAVLDGAYLALRYVLGGSVEERKAGADDWDNNPTIGRLSVIGLVLTLPDFFMHAPATAREIPEALRKLRGKPARMAAEVAEQHAEAEKLGHQAAVLSRASDRAAVLAGQSERAESLSRARLLAMSRNMGDRAEKIAKAAGEAFKKGEDMQKTLHSSILHEMALDSAKFATDKLSYVGTATATGYGIHDNQDGISWVARHMLTGFANSAYRYCPNPGRFVMTVGTSHQSPV